MAELIDIFDENDRPTGKVMEKQAAHDSGEWHRTAHIWIINSKKELLLQLRSPNKSTHPNMWDISAAGHIDTGEDVITGGIRELKEELGVDIKADQLKYLFKVIQDKNPRNKEFAYVFLVELDLPVESYVFSDNEVAEVKYIPYKKLKQMVDERSDKILYHREEYKGLFEQLDQLGEK